jgi:hypothetical protein
MSDAIFKFEDHQAVRATLKQTTSLSQDNRGIINVNTRNAAAMRCINEMFDRTGPRTLRGTKITRLMTCRG